MTPAQARALDAFRSLYEQTGYAPTYSELAGELDVSTPRAFAVVQELVDDGKLRRSRRCGARAIELPGHVDLRPISTAQLRAELARRGETVDGLLQPERITYDRHVVTCALDSCFVEVKRGMLMCRRHWFALPYKLQEGLKRACATRDEATYGTLFQQAVEIAARADRGR